MHPATYWATRVNDARTAAGRTPVTTSASMNAVAQSWAERVVARWVREAPGTPPGTLWHNPNYGAEIPAGWTWAGENIGLTYEEPGSIQYVNELLTQWHNSPGHAANLYKPSATHTGSGWARYTINPGDDIIFGVTLFADY